MEQICQSCAMPFEYGNPGTNADGVSGYNEILYLGRLFF